MTNLLLLRHFYTADTTIGKLFIDGEYFSYTLEDAVRPPNIKVYGSTAIEDGTYKVELTYSPKFGRVLPFLHMVPNFTWIRMHGGNDKDDTEGCILVAKHRAGAAKIYDSMIDELVEKLEGKEDIYIEIKTMGNV